MRKLLLVILLAVFGIAANATTIEDLPPLERSVVIMERFT
jgi:hypothetical protein